MTEEHYETFVSLDTDRSNISNFEQDSGERGEEGLKIQRNLQDYDDQNDQTKTEQLDDSSCDEGSPPVRNELESKKRQIKEKPLIAKKDQDRSKVDRINKMNDNQSSAETADTHSGRNSDIERGQNDFYTYDKKEQEPSGPPKQRAEDNQKCFHCIELRVGMDLLVRLLILTSSLSILMLLYNFLMNPFKKDENISQFHMMQAITDLPRLYAAWLCYKWIRQDNKETRNGLVIAFLIWFSLELLVMFNRTLLNQLLFGSSYPAYMYKLKHQGLVTADPKKPVAKFDVEELARQQAIQMIMDKMDEKVQFHATLRACIWLPLKVYFYYLATVFAKQMGVLDEQPDNSRPALNIAQNQPAQQEQPQSKKREIQILKKEDRDQTTEMSQFSEMK